MNLSSFTMKALAASLILASTTGVALAKNYKGEANYKGESMAVPCPAPRMLMAGWYVGGQVGYDSYRVRSDVDDILGIASHDPVINATGWMGGLYLGWGIYFNEWFYIGAEVQGNWSGAEQEYDHNIFGIPFYENNFEARASWGVSILPGIRLNDTSLGYVRLGWNWANLQGTQTLLGFSDKDSNTSNGFVFGVGIETLLIDNWSVRTEYDHTYYTNFSGDLPGVRNSWKPSDNQFTVGLSYHFG